MKRIILVCALLAGSSLAAQAQTTPSTQGTFPSSLTSSVPANFNTPGYSGNSNSPPGYGGSSYYYGYGSGYSYGSGATITNPLGVGGSTTPVTPSMNNTGGSPASATRSYSWRRRR